MPRAHARPTLPERWIGIDWGTTNIRAYLCDETGSKREMRARAIHVTECAREGWRNVLDGLVGDWPREAQGIVVACGMVGGKFGWREAPYVACPAGVRDLVAGAVVPDEAPQVRILPGLSVVDDAGHHDVIRGEETQLLGLFETLGDISGVICAPGTHTKWIEAKDGIVRRFFTAMTGEVFGLLGEHSILSQTLAAGGPASEEAFRRGLALAQAGTGVLANIFKVRADALFGALSPSEAAEFLSGLLVGDDVRHALATLPPGGGPVPLIGPAAMCDRYAMALAAQGVDCTQISAEQVTLAGLARAAREIHAREMHSGEVAHVQPA